MIRLHVIAILGSVASLPSAHAQSLKAFPADRLVDFVGTNLYCRYTDTPNWTNWDETSGYYNPEHPHTVKGLLLESGIRHYRDGAYWDIENAGPNAAAQRECNQRFRDLALNHGVWATLGIDMRTAEGRLDPSRIGPALDKILQLNLLEFSWGILGPNEYDNNNPEHVNGTAWPGEWRTYQQTLYTEMRARSAFDQHALLGGPLAFANAVGALGDVTAWIDYGTAHPYPGEGTPENHTISQLLMRAQESFANKPLIATEDGYDTNVVSETVAARYLVRRWLHAFRRGVFRTLFHKFVDDRSTGMRYGWVRVENATPPWRIRPKPAYYAMRNMIRLLADPGPAHEPAHLDYTLGGATTALDALLLQKRDGRFYLLLWQTRALWDETNHRERTFPSQRVNVSFQQPIQTVAIFEPGMGAALPTALQTLASPHVVDVDVGMDVVVLEIIPATASRACLDDDLVDFSKVHSHQGWTLLADEPLKWNQDVTRAGTAAGATNALVYQADAIHGFTAVVGFTCRQCGAEDFDLGRMGFEVSVDGSTWTGVPVQHLFFDRTDLPWDWYPSHWKTRVKNAAALPEDVRFLRVVNGTGADKDAPSLFRMSISHGVIPAASDAGRVDGAPAASDGGTHGDAARPDAQSTRDAEGEESVSNHCGCQLVHARDAWHGMAALLMVLACCGLIRGARK